MADQSLPLQGVRVLDVSTAWAGPKCSSLLGALGAQVIHVESIQYLDTARGWRKWPAPGSGVFPNRDPGARPWERSHLHLLWNRNKLGLTLNLRHPEGRMLFERLVCLADVLVENYKFGQLADWGIGYEHLRQLNPTLVQLSLSAFGHDSPYRGATAWGNQVDAYAGHTFMRRYHDTSDPEPGGTYGDPLGAVTGAFAVLTALWRVRRTGEGQFIDLSMIDAAASLVGEAIVYAALNGTDPPAPGNRDPGNAPSGVYQCRGTDAWLAIAVTSDAAWQRLCGVLQRPDWAEDPRFATLSGRIAHHDEIDAGIASWTIEQERFDAMAALQAAGVAAGVVQRPAETAQDPQHRATGYLEMIQHPEAGPYPSPGLGFQIQGIPLSMAGPAPLMGQHNTFVLGELLGLSAEELTALQQQEVIGTEPLDDSARASARRKRPAGRTE